MDVSTFHAVSEELAAILSEVTQAELRQPIPGTAGDVGDLYVRLVERNLRTASTIIGDAVPSAMWPDLPSRADSPDMTVGSPASWAISSVVTCPWFERGRSTHQRSEPGEGRAA